jgi:hypothetical protein
MLKWYNAVCPEDQLEYSLASSPSVDQLVDILWQKNCQRNSRIQCAGICAVMCTLYTFNLPENIGMCAHQKKSV